MINSTFPTPQRFKELELKTLYFVYNQPFFIEHFPKLAADASNAYIYYAKNNKGPRRTLISFESEFDGEEENRTRKIHVGGLVNINQNDPSEYEQYSYYFAICEHPENPSNIIRKFHFDYALPNIAGRRQPHPIFHLQYCGDLSPGLTNKGYAEEHINSLTPEVSVPRIPFIPVSLALLLDYLLREFVEKDKSEKGRNVTEWRSLVKENEAYLLGPYYDQCSNFIKRNENNSKLLGNFYYGEEE